MSVANASHHLLSQTALDPELALVTQIIFQVLILTLMTNACSFSFQPQHLEMNYHDKISIVDADHAFSDVVPAVNSSS